MELQDAVDFFLNYLKNRINRPDTTIATYKSMLSFFVRFCGAKMPISDLTVKKIDDYADSLILKPRSKYNRLSAIRSFIKFLYGKNMTDIRPESIDLPIFESDEANFLDYEDQKKMWLACRDIREKTIVALLIRTGARISELVNLRVNDVFERSIVIRRGKGRKSRITFITKRAEEVFREYLRGREDGFVFENKSGEQISRQFLWQIIKKIATRAGILKKVSPHTLRHTFATNMLRAGARVEDVQKMMGHSKIQTTLIYMHFTDRYLQKRYDEFAEIQYKF